MTHVSALLLTGTPILILGFVGLALDNELLSDIGIYGLIVCWGAILGDFIWGWWFQRMDDPFYEEDLD